MLGLILFIIILGGIVAIHEFGHFIFAKLANIYVYEFSIGFGKKIFSKKRNNSETEFSVRLFPLGGYVAIAGQDAEIVDENVPKDKLMCEKNFLQRFLVLIAGPFNNFLLAFLLLLISAFIYGSVSLEPYIGNVAVGYPAYEAGIEAGDLVLSIDGEKIKSWDKGLVKLQTVEGDPVTIEVKKTNGMIVKYQITPVKEVDFEGNESYKLGIQTRYEKEYGFFTSIKYAFTRTISLFGSMIDTLKYLFTGKVGVNKLSGPLGIYSLINSQSKEGLEAILYLTAYLSINVGVINLLPFPAFDGGRILFLIIEKVFKKPVSSKTEYMINSIGFMLLIALLIYVTFNDIIRMI